ncbi:PAP2 (type 2 phosphatidic acid phosphatase) family protein [Peptoniphilus sp. ING2-D1G]|nr:PAP2 (type 2 phosphatidic acid phosphatase) family protein [Peptoniphilus sp. ING2-D1G]
MEKLILDLIAKSQNTIFDNMSIAFNILGTGGIFFVIIGIVMILNKKTRLMGIHVLISLGLCLILGNLLLKPTIGRVRPYVKFNRAIIVEPLKDFSFPSGHTYSAFSTAFSINYYDEELGKFMMFVGAVMGFTRMYLYVHYPTDILGGVVLGYICAKIADLILKQINVKKSEM